MDTPLPANQANPGRPRVMRGDFVRLTDGAGLSLFGYVTAHPLEDVLSPGYFDGVHDALERHDRIELTADAGGESPKHRTLVVVDRGPGRGVTVKNLRR